MEPKRNRSLWWLGVGAILAAAAGILGALLIEQATDMDRVLVLTRDVEAFTSMPDDALRIEERPRAGLPSDVLRDPQAARGRFSRALLLEGTMLRQRHLAEAGDRGALASRLTALNRPQLRQMAIPYSAETGVGGRIERNDRVDIQVTLKRLEVGGQVFPGPLTMIVARNVPVMEVVRANPQSGDAKGNVIVAIDPETAAYVTQGLEGGTVRLLLNGYKTDESAADLPPITPQAVMRRFGLQPAGEGSAKR